MKLEKTVQDLESILNRLETEELSLDDSLALYEAALEKTSACMKALQEVDAKLKLLGDKEATVLDSLSE